MRTVTLAPALLAAIAVTLARAAAIVTAPSARQNVILEPMLASFVSGATLRRPLDQ